MFLYKGNKRINVILRNEMKRKNMLREIIYKYSAICATNRQTDTCIMHVRAVNLGPVYFSVIQM